jgi:hypothetical protein
MGGGISSSGDLTLDHVTVSGNGAGSAGTVGADGGQGGTSGTPGSGSSAGVWAPAQSTLARSIFSGNSCDVTSFSLNDLRDVAFQSPGCAGAPLDPRLGPLADNGGPAQTLRLGAGSGAIDHVAAGAGCPAVDQRGALRPFGAGCDAGAYEVAPPTAITGPASALTGTTASVAGTIDTRGVDTGFRVEFGPTTAYGRAVAGIAAGGSTPTSARAELTGLTPLTIFHYRLVAIAADGTSTGGDRAFTTSAAVIAGGPGAPRLSRLSIRPRSFGVVPKGGKRRARTRTHVGLGATIRFRLSERARVRLAVQRTVAGRRTRLANGRIRCVVLAPGRRVARAARCVLHPGAGALRRAGAAGANRIAFSGRIGTRALAPGAYRLVVVATDPSGARSAPARVAFTVVRPPPL